MALVLPNLPRDVVEHIRSYVYGPEMLAFMATYGERIPARMVRRFNPRLRLTSGVFLTVPFISSDDFQSPYMLTLGDGLAQQHDRYIWNLPTHSMHYLASGMPILLQLGAEWSSVYTMIELRATTLLVGFGTCAIEIPTSLIHGISLYVDIFNPGRFDDMFIHHKEVVAANMTERIQRDSEIGLVKNDDVEYDEYTTERWLYAIQCLAGVDLCC